MHPQISCHHKLSFLAQSALVASLMLFAPSNHAEQYYKWVDRKGSTHYTTTPPPKGSKKQGQVSTYGSPSHSIQNNESNNPSKQPNIESNKNLQPPPTNTPEVLKKSEQLSPRVASPVNRAV